MCPATPPARTWRRPDCRLRSSSSRTSEKPSTSKVPCNDMRASCPSRRPATMAATGTRRVDAERRLETAASAVVIYPDAHVTQGVTMESTNVRDAFDLTAGGDVRDPWTRLAGLRRSVGVVEGGLFQSMTGDDDVVRF